MKSKIISMIMVIVTVFSITNVAFADSTLNLIGYLETHEVTSRAELMAVIENKGDVGMYTYPQAYACDLDENEISFRYEIDYENSLVIVDTIYQTNASSYTTSGRATHDVCSEFGVVMYTVVTTGTFARTSQTVTCTVVGGSFTRPNGSDWQSTPSFTKGFISRTKAYARTSGTATSSIGSKNYSLTLMCDTSGVLTSSYSS